MAMEAPKPEEKEQQSTVFREDNANKCKYYVPNWPEYNRALKRRGSLTLWIEEDALTSEAVLGKKKSGGQQVYSDRLIEMIFQLKAVYGLTLRSVEGFTQSILQIMGYEDIACPDYTTLSRRGRALKIKTKNLSANRDNIEIAIDSTGLKISGEGEWKCRKHGPSKRRGWRKLHLAVDVDTGDILASVLTDKDVHDADVVPDLLDQISNNIEACSGDGAYDKAKVREDLQRRGIRQKIPPQTNAVPQNPLKPDKYKEGLRERDEAIDMIDALGGDEDARKMWKIETEYHKRSLSENAMFRRKTLFSPKLSSKRFDMQQVESAIIINAMNKMTLQGMPKSQKVA